MYQKSIKHVSYDSLRPNERSGTKKFCKKFLSYIDPFDNCAISYLVLWLGSSNQHEIEDLCPHLVPADRVKEIYLSDCLI